MKQEIIDTLDSLIEEAKIHIDNTQECETKQYERGGFKSMIGRLERLKAKVIDNY